MRFARPLLVTLTIALVGCSGGDDVSPLPAEQRFLTAEDAPGTQPDPVEEGQATENLDEFITAFSQALVDPDEEEMNTVFGDAGFEGAGFDVRFLGETHTHSAPHLYNWFIELDSEDAARSVLDWIDANSMKPCPMSCATKISTFDVDGIEEASGVRRLSTARNIEIAGTEGQQPTDSYLMGFTLGPVVYTVDLQGPPGSVSEEQAQEIISAYFDRLTSN